jgi:hypothetical protein
MTFWWRDPADSRRRDDIRMLTLLTIDIMVFWLFLEDDVRNLVERYYYR